LTHSLTQIRSVPIPHKNYLQHRKKVNRGTSVRKPHIKNYSERKTFFLFYTQQDTLVTAHTYILLLHHFVKTYHGILVCDEKKEGGGLDQLKDAKVNEDQ
jgi:hypothetical protein